MTQIKAFWKETSKGKWQLYFDMNKDTYALRRKVMDLIYEIKKIYPLPRITVRITEDDSSILGVGRIGANIIWISKSAVKNTNLRTVVYHEVLHTVFGVRHHEGDILMAPVLTKGLTKKQCQDRFLYWIKRRKT